MNGYKGNALDCRHDNEPADFIPSGEDVSDVKMTVTDTPDFSQPFCTVKLSRGDPNIVIVNDVAGSVLRLPMPRAVRERDEGYEPLPDHYPFEGTYFLMKRVSGRYGGIVIAEDGTVLEYDLSSYDEREALGQLRDTIAHGEAEAITVDLPGHDDGPVL